VRPLDDNAGARWIHRVPTERARRLLRRADGIGIRHVRQLADRRRLRASRRLAPNDVSQAGGEIAHRGRYQNFELRSSNFEVDETRLGLLITNAFP
jgi:hypothetical protein